MKKFQQIPFNPARWPFFYGWMILFWGVIGVILSVPGQTTGVSAFIEPLIESLGVNRLNLSYAYMFGTLSSSFLLTPAGKLFDRIGARWMAFGSCTSLGLVLLLLSNTGRLASLLSQIMPEHLAATGLLALFFFMLRLSGQGILTMASRNMVMKWFDHYRGLASGISSATVSSSFSYTPVFFSGLIGQMGWSTTWLVLGLLLILIFAPLLLIFFRDNPEECGLIPDGKIIESTKTNEQSRRQFTLIEARKTFPLWIFTITLALQALVLTAVSFHIESIFNLAGMDSEQGFKIFIPIAYISIGVTLLGGWLSDRIELRWFLIIMLLGMAINLLGLSQLAPGWPMACLIIGGGVANGLFGILMSMTWPHYYGRKNLGAISGFCMTFLVIFSAIGPVLYSKILRWTEHYTAGHMLCLIITLALLIGAFYIRNPQHQKTDKI